MVNRKKLIQKILHEGLNLVKANRNTEWVGSDINLETSLFEYGFVARQPKNKDYPDEWFILFQVGSGDEFDTGWKREEDLNDLMLGKDWMDENDIQQILDSTGDNIEEWLRSSFLMKLDDLVGYYGWDNIMGTSYNWMSKNEAIGLLNKYSGQDPIEVED